MRPGVLVLAVLVLFQSRGALAQSRDTGRLRVGVALSGGAAKGLAHIGVLRVLQEAGVPIDVITGTSMGALVGGLRAAGYDADRIAAVARGIDWDRLFSDAPDRGQLYPDRRFDAGRTVLTVPFMSGRPQLPVGVVGGRSIHRMIARLTWSAQSIDDFSRLPIPFAAVATDLETGGPVVLDHGVLADALRATMSIPGAFGPMRMDGRLLVDGGVVRNLPAEDARRMGADVVICSDVSAPLAKADRLISAIDVLLQVVAFGMAASTDAQRHLCDVLIIPEIGGTTGLEFDDVDDWISRGEAAARQALPSLRALVPEGTTSTTGHQHDSLLPDSVRVSRIELRGIEGRHRRLAERAISLQPGEMDAEIVDRALVRLYSTEQFASASYHITTQAADTVLVIDAAGTSGDEVGFGFRYDDRYKASLLFTGSFYDILGPGSLTHLDVRLGEQLAFIARHSRGRGVSSPVTLSGELMLARFPLDLYVDGLRFAALRTSIAQLSVLLGSTVGRAGLAGVRAGLEWTRVATAIAPIDASTGRSLSTFGATYRMDTRNRVAFPTRGVSAAIDLDWSIPLVGERDYFQHFADLDIALPLARPLTLQTRFYAGIGHGDIPYHHLFFLGGATAPGVLAATQPTFDGLDPQERSGKAIQLAQVGLQWEPRARLFARARVAAAGTADQWSADLGDYSAGWSISLGVLTIGGPIEASIAARSSHRPVAHLSIGHVF